ncbi:hypothetical protein [Erythrobacter sp. WG]|uniref:hypothetical protein n=1 Tax=Erythrobacter sp. WG TaxID=2985510 RepID=UPI00226F3AA9|nr:hypothetical protein [Erythrobacter sp. WG]MCX9146789.1 hypothetical protein [Erythrobacter sp. WG]
MEEFDYAVTLFGLLLGLALTEALAGLARALKSRHHVRIGWSTAMLGILVACDVVTFWVYGWQMRQFVSARWPVMFAGFVVTGIYFVAASLIFPASPQDDHEAHFAANYRLVLAGVLICNIALYAWVVSIVGADRMFTARNIVISWSLLPATLIAIFARERGVVLGCIGWMIALYPLSLVWP